MTAPRRLQPPRHGQKITEIEFHERPLWVVSGTPWLILAECPLPRVKRTFSDSISGVSRLMSAFLQSGRFYPGETPIFRVRFRPKADIEKPRRSGVSRNALPSPAASFSIPSHGAGVSSNACLTCRSPVPTHAASASETQNNAYYRLLLATAPRDRSPAEQPQKDHGNSAAATGITTGCLHRVGSGD